MYMWMALGSLFWGVVVAGIVYVVGRTLARRTEGIAAQEPTTQEPFGAGALRPGDGIGISEEEIRRMRDLL